MSSKLLFPLCLIAMLSSCEPPSPEIVRTGLDRVDEFPELFAGKRVGIITNHTAYDTQGRHITDVFMAMPGVTVTALFGPEHGIRGQEEAGSKIDSEVDPLKDVPIFSLYGETNKPTPKMLENVDVLVYDIQDVGARFYTYIYTMALAMEAAAEQGKPFVVLDRPNPIGGELVEGNLLEPEFATFVGLYPIPVRHGMTVGELAKMFSGEGWLTNGGQPALTVVPLENWRRYQWYDQTGLRFIKPSPNIPDLASATVYPGICLMEGTTISEGRGTPMPFQLFGAPWIDGRQICERLNALNLPGVIFQDTVFTPVSTPGASSRPKHMDRPCGGAYLRVTDRQLFQPYRAGIHAVNAAYQMYPDSLDWRVRHFDRLCGTASVRETIIAGGDLDSLVSSWDGEIEDFRARRVKYLLYQ